MDKFTKETDDRDLERLFAEARRYPLLTAEEERDIDQRKWSAVYEIQDAMVADDAARAWLVAWAESCSSVTPDIHRFRNRDNHFVLRREVVDYLDGGSKQEKAAAFRSSVNRMRSFAKRQQAVNELELPASLVVGLATWLLRKSGSDISDTVADGLEDWESQWPEKPRQIDFRPALLRDMKRAHLNYTEARDTLVMHNLRLVYSIAGKHKGKGIAYLDLIQEGILGLLRAAEKYESRKGFRFSTYCFNWITQSIRRYVGDSGGLIRYPTHVQEQVAKLYRHKHLEQARSGVEPTEAELADSAGISVEKTRNLLQLRNLGISLDAPQYEDDDGSMIDTIPGGPFADTENRAEIDSLSRCLMSSMDSLEPAEREVVIARWGLHDGPPLSRAEIADRMSVSREWVRQLERSALDKLAKSATIKDAYEDYGSASSW